MVIDVAVLMAAKDDATLDRFVAELTTGINRRVRQGLKVIADIHPFSIGMHRVPGFADVDLIDGPKGPKFTRFIYVVSHLAAAIRTKFSPADVALELFNEPPLPAAFSDKEPWNAQIKLYWHQIRKILPDHTIIVAGMGFAEIDGTVSGASSSGIVSLRPLKFDGNTGYAFHPYESATFTQQGYPGFFSHVHGLTFPAANHPGGQKAAEQQFETSINVDARLSVSEKHKFISDFVSLSGHSYSFARYWSDFGSRSALAKRLAIVTSWADANGVNRKQIMNTEFGVSRNRESCTAAASDTSATEFIRSTLENSVAAGLGVVTIHEAQGSCFAISNDHPPFEFDRPILDALRLH